MEATAFLTFLITSLLAEGRRFDIHEKHDDLGTLLTLTLAAEDMGTVIGRQGKTIEAIRTVLRVFWARHDQRVNLKIIEKTTVSSL